MGTECLSFNPYEQIDRCRRWLGKCLDAIGCGPLETPHRTVFSEPCLTLRCYDADPLGSRPVVLIVPAPIKSAFIWDIAPWASVVRQLLQGGFRVYLAQWTPPGLDERGFGLADYADRLIGDCLEAIRSETGQPRAFLVAHSLGGTCAAVFSALHPQRVRGLVLLGTPLHFGRDVDAFGPLVAQAPPPGILTARVGNVPGSFLNAVSLLASPATFGTSRWLDWLGSLTAPKALWTHLLVERWTLDETALPQRLFEELVQWLYREDRFLRGTLTIAGRRATSAQVVAPLLSVVDRRCQVAPPEAVLPFHHAVGSTDARLLWYRGDTGVALQHVGMLVGENAHRVLWPAIIRWMHYRSPQTP